jgi:hypothetical protein
MLYEYRRSLVQGANLATTSLTHTCRIDGKPRS